MSTVMRASVLGYCMGVRRAMDAAEKALTDYPDCFVYTLGPLIHNKTALADLASRGLLMLDNEALDTLCNKGGAENCVVIIRAHGTTPEVREKLKKAGALIIDATCPRVLANQKRVKSHALKKYLIVIAGDKNHGEVGALVGEALAAGAECRVVQNEKEATLLAREPFFCSSKIILISQTTIGFEEYEAIKNTLCKAYTASGAEAADIKVFNTICPATSERQNALKALCKKVDGVLVVGGKDSANTKRLFQTACSLCSFAAHIENACEIPDEFRRLKTVGITAGASTPDEVIREVEKSCADFCSVSGDVL